MSFELVEFYKTQITKYEDLKTKCQRPDRVSPIIEAYKDELEKLNGGLMKYD